MIQIHIAGKKPVRSYPKMSCGMALANRVRPNWIGSKE